MINWLEYYQKQKNRSDEEIEKMAQEKKRELAKVLYNWQIGFGQTPVKVAVLGCGDIRMMEWHRRIFGEFLGQDVRIITFDIEIEHLEGEQNVYKHDVIDPLPKGPFDVVYGHVLLKFLKPADQWRVIWNAYEALKDGGRAILVMDKSDYTDIGETWGENSYQVMLEEWLDRLYESKIRYDEIGVDHGLALVIYKQMD